MGFRNDIVESSRKHSSRIVLALDLTGPAGTRLDRAARLLQDLGDEVAAIKLNWHLLLVRGLAGITEMVRISQAKGLPVIADVKLNDIGSTNVEAAAMLFEGGVSAVIANPFVGAEEGLAGVGELARSTGRGLLLLVYMSHTGAREGYGLRVDGEPLYLEFARRVRDWDADGAIVSAKSLSIIEEVRGILKKEQLIISPGVGFQGGEGQRAVAAGTNFTIIGRSIVDAAEPLSVLREFNRAMPVP